MKTIDVDELEITKRYFSRGCFSYVHLASLENRVYCFKEFKQINQYPSCIIDNLSSLTCEDFDNEYLTPKMMVTDNNDIIGYLSLYNEHNNPLYNTDLSFGRKVAVLKDTKEKIQKLHNKHKIIHGDLSPQNILFDENLEASLIDFDSALRFGEKLKSTISLSWVLEKYIDHFDYDYRADIYRFNITTLTVLNDLMTDEDLITCIIEESMKGNQKVKSLSRELLIKRNDPRHEYSPDYIIDYF